MKKKIANEMLIIIAFIFNIIIFAPIEIFYTNKNELYFELNDILPFILIIATITSIICILILRMLKNKGKNIFLRILFALTTALYIQGNFLNFGYSMLDGSKVEWELMIGKGIINIAIWLTIIVFPYLFKKLKIEENFRMFSSVISLFIILVEIITLIVISVPQEKNVKKVLSNEDIFNFSKSDNIVVFMSDTFEAEFMNQVLENSPEYKEKLQDFIYFDNCTGTSTYTYSSMPVLLTGIECQVGNDLKQNLKYCFDNTNLYKILKENNYNIELYTEERLKPEYEYIDNLREENKLLIKNKTKGKITKEIYKLTMYRYLPHFLKKNFTVNAETFNTVKNDNNLVSYKEKSYFLDDVILNKELLDNGITIDNSKKCFKFYQLNGVHRLYDTTREIEYDKSIEYRSLPEEERRYNECIATLNILSNYINELKKSGAYDNTTIIFLADHGYYNRFHTTLLVKKAYEKSEFKISSAPVSLLEDLVPTILNTATNTKNYGKDFFDYEENESRIRTVYDFVYRTDIIFGNTYKITEKKMYKIDGLAKETKNYYLVSEENKE